LSRRAAWNGVRAAVVATKRVTIVERRASRKMEGRGIGKRTTPAASACKGCAAEEQPRSYDLVVPWTGEPVLETTRRACFLLVTRPSTGEPDAGDPPVRFGGRGDVNHVLHTPIRSRWLFFFLFSIGSFTLGA
jgi:hypothetical protein